MGEGLNRRSAIKGILASTATLGMAGQFVALGNSKVNFEETILKGNINHSVSRWCFDSLDLETLCKEAQKMGITGIDLVGPEAWPTLKKYNLISTMCNGAELNLEDGFNDPIFHKRLQKRYSEMIPRVAAAGYKNLICFSGSRRGKTDQEGLENCVTGLLPLVKMAEKYNIILVMELLNSKIDHKDYQCDRTSWGVALAKRINSPNFKLLYDIYHMQIDEGDVIRTITNNHEYIAHYHTAGVPGRHEIDGSQELNYPAIMKAIAKSGFKGFVGQEFIPVNSNKLESLQQAIAICDI